MGMARFDNYDAEVPVIEAIRGGDRYAFSELVRRHSGWVRGVVFGVLGNRDGVEDVSQQVWTAVWQRIGELREPNRWRPWVYRLARNAAIDAGREWKRRRQRFQTLDAEHANAEPANRREPGPGDARRESGVAEKHRMVLSAVKGLPALYREPFVLRHLSGWTYREIADVMGMPVDSVETRLVRARRLLRESLRDEVK